MSDAKPSQPEKPISNGPNARPRDETISSTGAGLPNDSSEPVDVSEEEEKKIETAIRSL